MLISALCGVPADAAMLAGGPTAFVSEKLADDATPATVANHSAGTDLLIGIKCR